jgi:MFS transporter, PPP family, 3-phenylpropionic acid transporter
MPGSPFFRLKAHYVAAYAVLGCVSPYLTVYLREVKALEPSQIGFIFAAGQSGVLFLPLVMTFLADRYGIVGPLLMALFAINLLAMGSLTFVVGFTAVLVAVFFNQIANQPQIALSDGLFFSLQREPGARPVPFSSVRVWGTIGFIVPSLLIFAVYDFGGLRLVPYAAMVAALLGWLNARSLPRRLTRRTEGAARLPTLEAARLFARPRVAVFCLGMGLIFASNTAFYGFYPLYLTQQVGIDARWVGLIANIGVALEIGFMLGFERLRTRWGLRGVVMAGAVTAILRMALLALVPSPIAAVALQVGHGLTIIGLMVAPVMYLNSLAGDSYRNSVQGWYVMVVVGIFAIVGNTVSGVLAQIGLVLLYRVGLVVVTLGTGLVAVSFFWPPRRARPSEARTG